MKRIFLSLVVVASIFMLVAIVYGLKIGDAKSLNPAVQSSISSHLLVGLAALTFSTLVHAILLTYFMGTGRWLEETSRAYSLDGKWHRASQKLKYSLLPGMTACILMLVATGALGAAADPATPVSLDGTLGLSGEMIHFLVAVSTAMINLLVNGLEYFAVLRNSVIVESVLAEVRRIREERGLPVEPLTPRPG